MDTVNGIDLSAPAVSSLVMRDLSEYATLTFLAAFDVQPSTLTQTGPKRITYIALMKKTMPLLVDLYSQFKATPDIYADGTLEAVISVSLRSCFLRCTSLILVPMIGVLHPYQDEVRLPCSVEIRQRPSAMENRHYKLPARRQRMLSANERTEGE